MSRSDFHHCGSQHAEKAIDACFFGRAYAIIVTKRLLYLFVIIAFMQQKRGRPGMCANIQVKQAVILASGYGKRMRKASSFPSKPMTPICQKPLISYIIDLLIDTGVEKIYIVYHSVTADVLKLIDYSPGYAGRLEFIEEDVQRGTLLTFSRIKEILTPPFIMAFEDVVARKSDFINMMDSAGKYLAGGADLLVQTVRKPSIPSEKALVTENGRVVKYQKDGITGRITRTQEIKYGGMVYLWLSSPFSGVDKHLSEQQYKISLFLEQYIPAHSVFEMPIEDMWDVDTPEEVRLTEEILKM